MFWTVLGIGFAVWLLLVILFTLRIDYHVSAPLDPESPAFWHVIQSTCQTTMHDGNRVEILTNGPAFYPPCTTPLPGPDVDRPRGLYPLAGPGGRTAH